MSNIFIKNISKSYICRDGAIIFIINIVKTTFFHELKGILLAIVEIVDYNEI